MQWYGPTDGVTDCSKYLSSLIRQASTNSSDRVIELPSGVFNMQAPIAALPQIAIRGQSKLSTVLIKSFHGGSFFRSTGAAGNGIVIERMAVLADPKYRPGNFVNFTGAASSPYQPDNFQLRELYVSQNGAITESSAVGGGLWQNGLIIDGINRTHPQGLRIGVIENCEIFNCIDSGVWIRNGVGVRMTGGGCYPGAASVEYPNGTGIFVTGGAALAITGASWNAGFASITTAESHALLVGDTFEINGSTPSGWNGQFVATTGTGANQINFAITPNPGGMTVNGNVTNPYLNSVSCQFTDVINNCVLNISRSSYGSWTGGIIGSLATDGSSRWRIETACPGSIVNNLVDSTVNIVGEE